LTDIGFVLVFPGFGMVLLNGFGFLINVVEHQSTSETKISVQYTLYNGSSA